MPSQTIQLQAAWYFPSFSRWFPPPGSRPAIDAGLRGADPRFLQALILAEGEIRFRLASSQTQSSATGQDLTSQFEDHGSLELIVGANSLLVALGGADTTEPYVWTPTNGAEVAAFEALLSGTSGSESGQLIIRDFTPGVPIAYTVDAGDVAFAFTIPQPTVTYTPPAILATSDWDGTGYQAPIVLALLPATISGADITVDPVTAIAGDLVVASDLTIDGVERHAAQDSIRLRKTGDGLFSTYFDNEGTPLYPDAKAFIVIDNQARTHIPFTIGATGGGFNNWSYDTASQESLVEAIATGDRFLLAIAEPITDHVVDAGDVEWAFHLPQPTVTYTPPGAQAVNAGDVAFAFHLPQPSVTYTPPGAQGVDAGDVAFVFDIPQPTVTYTPAGAQGVDAGDVAFVFDIPQPTVTYTPAGAQGVDAGDVAWNFDIPEPIVTYTVGGAAHWAINAYREAGSTDPLQASDFDEPFTAHIGFPGGKGQPGVKGLPGDPGNPGAKGSQGSSGSKGSTGQQGDSGSKGSRGSSGSKGSRGQQGSPGSQGSRGSTGSKGSRGQQGSPGSQGSTGGSGQKGNPGQQGNPGPMGSVGGSGQKGNPGQQGNPGPMGSVGGSGQKGNPGQQGNPGPMGSVGGSGQKGNPGQQGNPGGMGSVGSTGGSGAPGEPGQGENYQDGYQAGYNAGCAGP